MELTPAPRRVAVEVDGLVIRDAATEGAVEVTYRRDAGLVVRLDPRRYQERNRLKLSLLDLPLLPEQLPDGLRQQLNRRNLPPRAKSRIGR